MYLEGAFAWLPEPKETSMPRAIKTDPALEAMIEAEVAEALRMNEGIFGPEELEELGHLMRIVMRTHPAARQLLEQLGPRAAPDESGKEDVSMFKGARTGANKKAEGQ
jgi:hypothetical protein